MKAKNAAHSDVCDLMNASDADIMMPLDDKERADIAVLEAEDARKRAEAAEERQRAEAAERRADQMMMLQLKAKQADTVELKAGDARKPSH